MHKLRQGAIGRALFWYVLYIVMLISSRREYVYS